MMTVRRCSSATFNESLNDALGVVLKIGPRNEIRMNELLGSGAFL